MMGVRLPLPAQMAEHCVKKLGIVSAPELGEKVLLTHTMECATETIKTEIISFSINNGGSIAVRISGFGSLGKSSLATNILSKFPYASLIHTDRVMPDREERKKRGLPNGDDPAVLRFELLQQAVKELSSGNSVDDIVYNHVTGKHNSVGKIFPSNLIIIEGACALYSQLNLPIPSFGIFLDADQETKIQLRHMVNTTERGYDEKRSLESMDGYLDSYNKFILPSKSNAKISFTIGLDYSYSSPSIINCSCK
ncbi:MAG: hypothetical protein QY322_00820 [bacterium]|nr:MAG: hypothetical protein QY322_00820 [bacterium]